VLSVDMPLTVTLSHVYTRILDDKKLDFSLLHCLACIREICYLHFGVGHCK